MGSSPEYLEPNAPAGELALVNRPSRSQLPLGPQAGGLLQGRQHALHPTLLLLMTTPDIAGTVAAMTESEPGVPSEKASDHALVLTGTALRRGQGVWLFSLM